MILIMSIQIILAIITFGMAFAYAKYGWWKDDDRGASAFAAPMGLICLVPYIGIISFIVNLFMTDFARYGIKFPSIK